MRPRSEDMARHANTRRSGNVWLAFWMIWVCIHAHAETAKGSDWPVPSKSITLGISTHFAQGVGDPAIEIPRMAANGWRGVRDEVFWSHTETAPGVYELPTPIKALLAAGRSSGISPVLLLGYGHPNHTRGAKPLTPAERQAFVRYAQFVTENVRGQVAALEIWNEWDIGIGGGLPGKPEDYLLLLREVIPVIRRTDPNVKILAGSMTPEGVDRGYLRALIELGLLDLVDGISVHVYVWSRKAATPQDASDWVRRILSYSRGKPLHITEIGWPTHRATLWKAAGSTDLVQRNYVCATRTLLSSIPSVRSIYFYGHIDSGSDPTDPEHRFGLIRQDGTPRPAFAINTCDY